MILNLILFQILVNLLYFLRFIFLSGEIGMSDELDSFGDSIFNGYLPSLWRKLCPDTQKPLGTILHCIIVQSAVVFHTITAINYHSLFEIHYRSIHTAWQVHQPN